MMTHEHRHFKGFTLIEILIVVVIISILASLILPRMLAQPEKAALAEAKQMLGAIRRAQMGYVDLGGGAYKRLSASADEADWNALGMRLPSQEHFIYTCSIPFSMAPPTSCRAKLNASTGCWGSAFSQDWVEMDLANGTFRCSGLMAGNDDGDEGPCII